MGRPKTVGEIPLGGGGGFPWWGVVILILIGGAGWWYFGNRAFEARRDAANAAAQADTLKLAFTSADSARRGWERRALTAESEKAVAAALSEELAAALKRSNSTARAVADLRAEFRDRFEVEGTVQTEGDTAHVRFERADSTFEIRGDIAIVGRIEPPDAEAISRVEALARLRAMVAISCDADGAPHVNAQSFDARVTISDLEATVSEDVACFGGRAPRLFSLKPQVTIGNGLLAGGAFVLGYLLGGK